MRKFNPNKLKALLDSPLIKVSGVRNMVGLSYNGFDKICKGESVPSANTLVAIADVLGKPLDYFFDEEIQYIENQETA